MFAPVVLLGLALLRIFASFASAASGPRTLFGKLKSLDDLNVVLNFTEQETELTKM